MFVIIERGWQMGRASRLGAGAGKTLPRQNRRRGYGHSPWTRDWAALLQSLNEFAQQSHHPELAASMLISFSFSRGGSMVARMVAYAPDRVPAAIEYAPGHYNLIGIDTEKLPKAALSAHELIIANGAGNNMWNPRPHAYFEKYHDLAPLTFMVQNRVPHCCVMNVTP